MKLTTNNTKDFEIIAKYLAGEMSDEEVFQFEKQAESFPENKKVIKEMKKHWDQIGHYQENKQVDANKAWDKLYNRLDNDQLIPEKRIANPFTIPTWAKWAASIIVVMTIASLSFYSVMRSNQNLISLHTGNDSNTLVQTLKDGSVIYLANNTTFSYPSQFSTKERKVSLKGEAFFDIYPNPKQPFLIETDKVIIEVLGTAFNVKSENGSQFELIVERGKVKVTLKNNPSKFQVVLPGEKITTSGNDLLKVNVNSSSYSSWKTKRMQFKDESLNNIIRVINKNYNSNIQLESQKLNDLKLTVTFYNNSLKQITNLICTSLNLNAEIKSDSTIVIKPIEK